MTPPDPTPYPTVNALLHELRVSVQAILGSRLLGMYLDGSLTGDDFDEDSDIDFVVVTDEELSEELFSALQAMHERLAGVDSPWASQLEGSYIPQRALWRYDPDHARHPNIERGSGERLKWVYHDASWIVHRYVLRERGIRLMGPPAHALIAPVSASDLRQAMIAILPGWAAYLAEPGQIQARGYQSYIVLSLCRVLYTLHHGTVVSKRAAARWAQDRLGEQWEPLIRRAWVGRHSPDTAAFAEDVSATLCLMRYTLEHSQQLALSDAGY